MTPTRTAALRLRLEHPAWLLMLAPVVWLCLWRHLGAESLKTSDEAAHTEVARSILMRGRPTDLFHLDKRYYGKPPLKIWVTTLLLRTLGQEEWVVRLPDAALATWTTLLVWALARRFVRGPATLAAPFLFVTAPYPLAVHGWREGVQDSALVLLMTLAAYVFLGVADGKASERRGLLATGALLGAASLVKSVVPFLLYPAMGAYLVVQRRWRTLLSPWLLLAGLLSAAPWIAWNATNLRGELGHNIATRVTSWQPDPHPPSAYVTWLFQGVHPWGPAIPLAIVATVVGAWRRPFDRFVLIWGSALYFPWLAANLKHPWYIYPAYPALALALARLLFPPELWTAAGVAPRWLRGAAMAVGAATFVVGAGVGLLKAREISGARERVPLHAATDWVKTLPRDERLIAIHLDPRTLCDDERYYFELSGARRVFVPTVADLISISVEEERLVVVLPVPELPEYLRTLAPHRDVSRVHGAAFFWPRCRKIRDIGRLPHRVIVALGYEDPPPPFERLAPVHYWDGFGEIEVTGDGRHAWLTGTGQLWFPFAVCGELRARLFTHREPNEARFDLPGGSYRVPAFPEGGDVALPVDVPLGGALGSVEVLGGCVPVDPSARDRRCLGISVANVGVVEGAR